MAVILRKSGGTSSTGTSHTLNYPSSPVVGDDCLLWVVIPSGQSVTTPSGWTQIYNADNGDINAYVFTRTYASGTTLALSTSSTDLRYVFVFINSNAPSPTIGHGQQFYTGTGTDPVDSGDTYVYTADGKGDSDTTADTTLGTFTGGIMCPTDLPIYFWAAKGASAPTPTVGADDTLSNYGSLPSSTTISAGLITSTYRSPVGRGFTLDVSATTVAFGTWGSENISTAGGGGPGGNGFQNLPPPTFTYQAVDVERDRRKSARANGGWYFPDGSYQRTQGHNIKGKWGTVQRADDFAALVPSSKLTVQPEYGGGITAR